MTRFMKEFSGRLGDFWKAEAEKELAAVKADLEAGQITIDDNGVARNCIGRVVMSDMLEKIALVTDKVDTVATTFARETEVEESLREYRANRHPYSAEELAEMRAAFGPGARVINVLSGEEIWL